MQQGCWPSGIIAEMLKAAGEEGVELARQLTEAVFSCGVILSDWGESFILNLYKCKSEAFDHGNYHGLKLTDQVMELLERILDFYIRGMVNIDEMQFGFVPGRGTIDAIFIVRQLQEKYIAAKKPLYFAFVKLEKAFHHLPKKVLWWALRSLWVEECAVRVQTRACTPRPGVMCGWMVSTVRSLAWELVSLAHCSSFWCWRHCHMSSALVYHGSSSMLMTWCSLWTPKRFLALERKALEDIVWMCGDWCQ